MDARDVRTSGTNEGHVRTAGPGSAIFCRLIQVDEIRTPTTFKPNIVTELDFDFKVEL